MQALTDRQCRAAKARLNERRPLAMLQVCLQSSLDSQQSWVTCHRDCHDSNVVQFVMSQTMQSLSWVRCCTVCHESDVVDLTFVRCCRVWHESDVVAFQNPAGILGVCYSSCHHCTAYMSNPGNDAPKCLHCAGIAHATLASSRQQDGEDAAVQRASTLFLQQVEDSRRRYAFEVEELKVRLKTARETRIPSLPAQDRVCAQLSLT